MSLSDTQTITVDSNARTYQKAWDPEFQKELANGNVSIRKATLTNGSSVLKISHQESKGVSRKQILVRDKSTPAEGTEPVINQSYVVLSTNNEAATAELLKLTIGFLNYLVGENSPVDEVLGGQM